VSNIDSNQIVSFDGRWGLDEEFDEGHHKLVTKNHTDSLTELVTQLWAKTYDVMDQQQYTITREAVHRETAESTRSRVIWWTFAEVLVLILLAGFQVYYLRSYFEVKTVV